MDVLWKLILGYVEINVDKVIIEDDYHDYVDLIEDLGYDSIKLMSLIIEIEEEYQIEIDERYLTLDKLRKYESLDKIIKAGGEYYESEEFFSSYETL